MHAEFVAIRESRALRRLAAFVLVSFIALSVLCGCGKAKMPAGLVKSSATGIRFAKGIEISERKTFVTPPFSAKRRAPADVLATLNDKGEIEKVTDDWLLLVNKTHPLSPSYEPTDLVMVKHQVSDHAAIMRYMREEAAEHLDAMCEAAAEAGHEMGIRTAYRPYNYQRDIFNDYVRRYGEEEANKFSARPGQSEHQTGLCADVTSPSVNYKLTTEYGEAPEGMWLAENAHRFGFIIRYPLGKEDITGYQYEPWHVRYVGREHAEKIYERGITLEEYLGVLD